MSDDGPEIRSPEGLCNLTREAYTLEMGAPVFTDTKDFVESVGPYSVINALKLGIDKAMATTASDQGTIYFKFWAFPLPGKRKRRRILMNATIYMSEEKEGSYPWILVTRGGRPKPSHRLVSVV